MRRTVPIYRKRANPSEVTADLSKTKTVRQTCIEDGCDWGMIVKRVAGPINWSSALRNGQRECTKTHKKSLYRFGLDECPDCPECGTTPKNPEHINFHCPRFIENSPVEQIVRSEGNYSHSKAAIAMIQKELQEFQRAGIVRRKRGPNGLGINQNPHREVILHDILFLRFIPQFIKEAPK